MNTREKKAAGLALAGLVLLIFVYCVLRFGFAVDVLDSSGWSTRKGMVQYLDYYGRPQLQWQRVDDKIYYFAPEDGNMVTGWQQIDDDRYYFGDDGVRASGWQTIDGKTYYLGEHGKMVTGWRKIDQKNYYFTQEGAMATGWQSLDGKLYYFSGEGYTLSGWVELDGIRYRFAEDGAVVTGWFEDETGRYFFDENGHPNSGWLDYEQERYYFDADGCMVTGWLNLGQDRHYFLPDGAMAVGEVEIDGVSSFFTSKGKYVLMPNPWNPVPADFVLDLVEIEGYEIDREAREPLQKMMDDCRAAGFRCSINNIYRSKATQQRMWNESVARYMAAGFSEAGANTRTSRDTALPGHSEHQTGLAVDIVGSQAMYDWLEEHCWEYGFILRYPDDRLEVTGIIFEPWHYRYVGTELSLELKELGLCLEEYMTMLTDSQYP